MSRTAGRTLWACACIALAWLLTLGRLYHWQISSGGALVRTAVNQRMLVLPLAPRGRILDRFGEPLSDPRPVAAVAVFPALLTDPAAAAAALARALGRPAAELAPALGQDRSPFWLVEGLPAAKAAAVRALQLPGVAVATLEQRFGPGSLAHHLVGYVNVDGGQLGMEATWDRALTGSTGPHLVAYLDGRGRPLGGLGIREAVLQRGLPPHDLYLTVDAAAQTAVESALDQQPAPEAGLLRAAAVVLDARRGHVLAMASRPDFDPRTGPAGVDPASGALVNRAVAAYPPGSVMKPLVVAAALAEGVVSPGEQFSCPGELPVGDQTFFDWKPGGQGELTLAEVVARSCNTALIEIGYNRLGRERLLAAAERFGLGRATGLPLWGEAAGSLPAATFAGEVAQLSFGQGLTVTPLQVARAYAALAADGRLPETRLVEKVTAPGGEVRLRPAPAPAEPAVPAWVAREVAMALMLATAPDGPGTGRAAWVEGPGSAGKTGTAQAVVDGREVSHAWFAGWTPARDPRYIIVVLVEEGGSGGTAAAPLFREIARRLPD